MSALKVAENNTRGRSSSTPQNNEILDQEQIHAEYQRQVKLDQIKL